MSAAMTTATPIASFEDIAQMHLDANGIVHNMPMVDEQVFHEEVMSALEGKIREADYPTEITLEVPKGAPLWSDELSEYLYESFTEHYKTPGNQRDGLKVVFV